MFHIAIRVLPHALIERLDGVGRKTACMRVTSEEETRVRREAITRRHVRLSCDKRLNGRHSDVGHFVRGKEAHGKGQQGSSNGIVAALQ